MKTRKCAFFIFNGFADWEPALVTTGLNKFSNIFKAFQVFDESTLLAWKELYKSGGMINKLFEG